MDRISNRFEILKQKNEKALIGFVTAGDPDISASLSIIKEMCKSGIDILELGIPFSDPTADGPVIQRSSSRALKKGVTIKTVFDMAKDIRSVSDVPIILFSYYNPIHSIGAENFYNEAIKCGADGVLIVDLPPEESKELTDKWPANDLALIRLIAPTTPNDRMKYIADSASGFIYMVSKTGVTGSAGLETGSIKEQIELLKSFTTLPVCVGFGVSTPEDVKDIASFADGIVIGSAFERLIEENINASDISSIIGKRVSEYKMATKI
ncbi:MAG: tryptophan synthase subunit alpha [Desulfobacterales bacterium]|nr:tryptophan synthase subunit alpha [Desulfobacterales bacterium]